MNKNLFATPTWLINNDILAKTGLSGPAFVGQVQDATLNRLLSGRTLGKLIDAESILGSNAYQATELLADLRKGIWGELATGKATDIYRRNLQKSYVGILINLLTPSVNISPVPGLTITSGGLSDKSDAKSIIRGHLVTLRTELLTAATRATDIMTKYHLQDLADRVNKALNPKN